MFKTKRLGDATLILAMIAGMLAGIIASSLSSLLGTTYASLESSGIGIKAQQLTKSRANEINALAYQDIQTYAPEPLRLIADTGLYRQTKVDPEITNADGSKSTVVTVDVFRSSTDTHPIFSLPITLSSKAAQQGVPTGTVIWFAALSPPDGFIICNGQSTAAYPELAKIVGSTVPDLRGEFIKGIDLGRGLDEQPTRPIRSVQNAGMPNITGSVGVFVTDVRFRQGSGALNVTRNGGWLNVPAGGVASEDSISFDASKSNSLYGTSNTVRPRNVALLPCIKI